MAHKGAWHIPSLDGLRGLSVLLVLSSHTLQSAQLPDVIPGSFGVTVFFFLSGYLITTLLRVEVEDTGSIAFGKFYLRRALRIFPPFYLVLLLAALRGHYGILIHTANHMEWSYVLGQALQLTNYLQIYFPTEHLAPGTDIFWSLAVEEHFYLIFPWIFLWLVRLEEPRKRAAVLLAVLPGIRAAFLLQPDLLRDGYPHRLDSVRMRPGPVGESGPRFDPDQRERLEVLAVPTLTFRTRTELRRQ
jgi:peptidoglycan/LPS O-acetylase OafA/YrhL